MKNDELLTIRREAARAYSTLVSRLKGLGHISPSPVSNPPVVDIAEINTILNSILSKGMPTIMIDELLHSVVNQAGSNSSEVLLRLFGRPQDSIRQAIVRTTRLLKKEDAAIIIHAALKDKSPTVVRLAEGEIDTRWDDGFWD